MELTTNEYRLLLTDMLMIEELQTLDRFSREKLGDAEFKRLWHQHWIAKCEAAKAHDPHCANCGAVLDEDDCYIAQGPYPAEARYLCAACGANRQPCARGGEAAREPETPDAPTT
jgi:hypothetical protein